MATTARSEEAAAGYRPAGVAGPAAGERTFTPPVAASVAATVPSPDLRDRVAAYFAVSRDAPTDERSPDQLPPPSAVRTLPDGCVDLVFRLDDRGPGPRAFVGGPRQQAAVYRHEPGDALLGVQLLPGAGHLLLGEPIGVLGPEWLPLDDLLGPEATRLALALCERPTLGARLELLESFLRARLDRRPVDQRVRRAVHCLLASDGTVGVGELGRVAGASPRNLGRLFHDWIGLSPKRLGRIVRFQAVLQRAACGHPPDWAALAAEAGYADQSHLVRDFAAFAGVCPSALFPRR